MSGRPVQSLKQALAVGALIAAMAVIAAVTLGATGAHTSVSHQSETERGMP